LDLKKKRLTKKGVFVGKRGNAAPGGRNHPEEAGQEHFYEMEIHAKTSVLKKRSAERESQGRGERGGKFEVKEKRDHRHQCGNNDREGEGGVLAQLT